MILITVTMFRRTIGDFLVDSFVISLFSCSRFHPISNFMCASFLNPLICFSEISALTNLYIYSPKYLIFFRIISKILYPLNSLHIKKMARMNSNILCVDGHSDVPILSSLVCQYQQKFHIPISLNHGRSQFSENA